MAKGKNMDMIGKWSFLVGVILAVIVGLLGLTNDTWTMVLVIIGLIVGFLNIADKEVTPFLMSGAVLIIASAFGGSVMGSVPFVGAILEALLAIFVPATVIVAIKNVWGLAKN